MGMFPTKILLATDGSESAAPATRAAADLSAATGSEIELVYVGKAISTPAAYNEPVPRIPKQRARPAICSTRLPRRSRRTVVRWSSLTPRACQEAGRGDRQAYP